MMQELAAEPRDPDRHGFATPWRRLGAWTIDAFILVGVIALSVLGIVSSCTSEGCLAGLVPFIFAPFITFSYSMILTRLCGATIGMRLTRIRAVSLQQGREGRPPSWGRSWLRTLVGCSWLAIFPALGQVAILVVRFPMFRDERRQGWHDKAARTAVVRSPWKTRPHGHAGT